MKECRVARPSREIVSADHFRKHVAPEGVSQVENVQCWQGKGTSDL